MDHRQISRSRDAATTFLIQLVLALVLWFFSSDWLYLRHLLAACACLGTAILLGLHFVTDAWELVPIEWQATAVANYSRREWRLPFATARSLACASG